MNKLQNFVLQSFTLQSFAFKRLIFVILVIFVILIMPEAKADSSYRIEVDDVINKLNIVITHPETKDKYLLHLKSGCGDIEKSQIITLTYRGNLDETNDSIKSDFIHSCEIDGAEIFHQKLYVKYVYSSNTRARILDEAGKEYYLIYGESCNAMQGYRRQTVYAFQGNDEISANDKVIFPNNDGRCSIDYIQEIGGKSQETETVKPDDSSDIKVPTDVTHVRAFARNGRVFLSWRSARDNEGISHYVISANKYSLNTKDVPFIEMPNQLESKATHYTVGDLENDNAYFFYVIAVDKSGNVSSNWSEEVEATPKASILKDKSSSDASRSLNLRIFSESDKSFLIRWDPITATRQSVLFDIDNRRDFSRTEYSKRYIRILKREYRKGKDLTLKVRAYDYRGLAAEEEIEFDF